MIAWRRGCASDRVSCDGRRRPTAIRRSMIAGAAVAQVIGCIFEALPDCPERRAARNANGWPDGWPTC